MSQTSVSINLAAAVEGLIADGAKGQDFISKIAEEALEAGRVVVAGTDIDQAALPASAADLNAAWGVTCYRAGKEAPDSVAAGEVPYIMRSGRVWMLAEDAIAANANPFVRHVAGVGESLGRIRSDADTSDATQVTWLRTLTASSGADELILVEVTLS